SLLESDRRGRQTHPARHRNQRHDAARSGSLYSRGGCARKAQGRRLRCAAGGKTANRDRSRMTPSRVRLTPFLKAAAMAIAITLVLCGVFAPAKSRAAADDRGARPWNSGVAVENSQNGSSKSTVVERGGKVRSTV